MLNNCFYQKTFFWTSRIRYKKISTLTEHILLYHKHMNKIVLTRPSVYVCNKNIRMLNDVFRVVVQVFSPKQDKWREKKTKINKS